MLAQDKETFEKQYCEGSEITLDFYHEHMVTLPWNCDYEFCKGWAAVGNNELSIRTHNEINGMRGET